MENRSKQFATLRQQAESVILAEAAENSTHLSPVTILQTVHDLRVHQVELEIQNEELRRTQAELDVSQAHHFAFYNLAPVGYCTISENGLIVEVNFPAATFLGLARSILINQPITNFVHQEDQDIYYLFRKKLLEIDAPQHCDLRVVRKDGTLLWVQLNAITAHDPDGSGGYQFVLSDITERKQAEEENIRKSAVITSLLDAIPDLIFFKDLQGTYLGCNPPLAEVVGCSQSEIVGKTDHDLFGQEIADFFREQDELMMQGGGARRNEEWISYPDGRKILVETLKAPFCNLDGELIGLVGIARDITERKQAEQRLLKSRENYLRIFENQMTAVCVFDVETRQIVDVNATLVRLYGYSREELLVGMEFLDLSAEKELSLEFICLNKSKESFSIPLRYHLKKDGTIFPVEIVGASYMRNGRLVMYGMIHDISQRQHAEEELAIIHGQLERKVLKRTADLEKTNTTLAMMLDYARRTEADIQERVVANLRANILGIVDVLKKQQLEQSTLGLVELLETTTLHLAHPIARNLESQLLKLTAREIQLASFIRLGKSTKELVALLNISKKTVEYHRDNLRRKLGIHNKKINLRTFLNSDFAE